jgi:hypothetical protein
MCPMPLLGDCDILHMCVAKHSFVGPVSAAFFVHVGPAILWWGLSTWRWLTYVECTVPVVLKTVATCWLEEIFVMLLPVSTHCCM